MGVARCPYCGFEGELRLKALIAKARSSIGAGIHV